MKLNKWTYGLASAGLVSFCSTTQAEEAASQLLTALSGTTISGYASASYIQILGADGPARQPHYTPAGNPNPLGNGFRLDVVGLQLQKTTTPGQFSAGYTVQALVGPDAVGYSDGPVGLGGGSDEFSVQAAQVDLHAPIGNGLDITLGHFNTIVGYEVNSQAENGNYTRSYGFNSEPFTHTGALLSYAFNDMVSVVGGVANAASGINSISTRPLTSGGEFEGLSTLGGVSITLDDSAGALSGSNLYFAVVNGTGDTGGATRKHYYASFTLPTPVTGFDLGFSWDYAVMGGASGGSGFAAAYGLYAAYAPENSDFSVNLRGEYANSNNGYYGLDGIDEDIYAITGTLNYNIWENVLTRLEIRYDWDAASTGGGFGETGMDDSQWLIALNAVYSF